MSDGKEHVLLLGDRVKAAKWLPYAKRELHKLRSLRLLTTVLFPESNVSITINRFGRMEKIVINAQQPTGRGFIGIPYDEPHRSGWGFTSATNNPLGTPGIYENYEAIIKPTKGAGPWYAQRWPEYVKKYPDPQYGVRDWQGSAGVLSWDGPVHRYCLRGLNVSEFAYGAGDNKEVGYGYYGVQVSNFPEHNVGNGDFYREGYYSMNGVGINAPSYQVSAGSYAFKDAFSGNIYMDGEILYTTTIEHGIILGAALYTSPKGITYLRAVIGEWDHLYGVVRDHFYEATLDNIKAGNYKLLAEYRPNFEVGAYDLIADDWLEHCPLTNTHVWAFNDEGTEAVAVRDYFEGFDSGMFRKGLKLDPVNKKLSVIWDMSGSIATVLDAYTGPDFDGYVPGNTMLAGIDYRLGEINMVFVETHWHAFVNQILDYVEVGTEYLNDYLWFSSAGNEKKVHVTQGKALKSLDGRVPNEYGYPCRTINTTYLPTKLLAAFDARTNVSVVFEITDERSSAYQTYLLGEATWLDYSRCIPNVTIVGAFYSLPADGEQYCRHYVYLEDQVLVKTERKRYTAFTSVDKNPCPCANGTYVPLLYAYNPAITYHEAQVFTTLENVLVGGVQLGAYQIAVLHIGGTVYDVMVHARECRPTTPLVSRLFRIDVSDGSIIDEEDVARVLDIKSEDFTYILDRGAMGLIGVI